MIDSFKGKHAFLSNFYLIEIQFDGIIYNSVEHAYQASKTIDLSSRLMISKLETPGRAKRMGQLVPIRSDWEDVKVSIMTRLVGIKFGNSFLRKKLIKTYPHELVEGNTWGDSFWGVCDGKGQNVLGKILVKVRDKIREGKNGKRRNSNKSRQIRSK